jgi:hypothetical protein
VFIDIEKSITSLLTINQSNITTVYHSLIIITILLLLLNTYCFIIKKKSSYLVFQVARALDMSPFAPVTVLRPLVSNVEPSEASRTMNAGMPRTPYLVPKGTVQCNDAVID